MNPLKILAAFAFALALALAGLAGLAGCATVSQEPLLEANLVNLHFTEATVFETVAVVEVRLTNLSAEDVRVTGASHKVVANGFNLGRGVSAATLTIPRLSSATQTVEFHLRNLAMARMLRDLQRTRVIHYDLDGTVYASPGAGRERGVKVRRSGDLDLNAVARPANTSAN